MATITINDLPANCALDRKAMAAIRGAGGGWLYGWMRPFVDAAPIVGSVVNFYQFNNFGGQMNNQIQVIDIQNSGANAIINVTPTQLAINVNQ